MSDGAAAGDVMLADIPRLLAALPPRIADIVTLQAARMPAGEALREGERAWTFAELDASTAEIAQRLAASGVGCA